MYHLVGFGPRGRQVDARAHHRQHPAARRDDLAVVAPRGSGVQHPVGFRAGDHVTHPGASRVVLRGHHHRHGGTVVPAQLAEVGQCAAAGRVQQLPERRFQ